MPSELGFALHVVNVLASSYDPAKSEYTSLRPRVVGRGTPGRVSGAARDRAEQASGVRTGRERGVGEPLAPPESHAPTTPANGYTKGL